jgi:hypothetical protein
MLPLWERGTVDTLHVAAALELRADGFWTFDEGQAGMAKAAGLTSRKSNMLRTHSSPGGKPMAGLRSDIPMMMIVTHLR